MGTGITSSRPNAIDGSWRAHGRFSKPAYRASSVTPAVQAKKCMAMRTREVKRALRDMKRCFGEAEVGFS